MTFKIVYFAILERGFQPKYQINFNLVSIENANRVLVETHD